MFELKLSERITKFIRTFEVVHISQVYRFFRNENKQHVERDLNTLLIRRTIFAHDDYLSITPRLPTSIINYADRIKAINVMCLYKSCDIKWFILDTFPDEIIFVNNDGVCYAVTVFDSQNWLTKHSLVKKMRPRYQYSDAPDPFNYIAIVPNTNLIPKIRDLGFAYFATLDNNGHAELLHEEADAPG